MVERELDEREQVDMRLRQEKDDAETASRIKSEFVATLSHEFRTPMNAVLGMTDLLHLTNLTRKQRGFVQAIQSSGDMLLSLIENALDLSRLESGVLEIQEQNFNVIDLLERALEITRHAASAKGLELVGTIGHDLNLQVSADKQRLRQVLINLISNAIKFTEKGEVSIEFDMACDALGDCQLLISVRDTGIGIDDAIKDKLFMPFTSGLRPQSEQQHGSGLGLSICKQLIENMGGEIEIKSLDGGGTMVGFWVPVRRVGTSAKQEAEKDERGPIQRVLVAHSNQTSALSISTYLRAWGIDYVCVNDADEAIRELRDAEVAGAAFGAAIVDTALTVEDGLQFVRTIRGIPTFETLRVVLLTSILQSLEIGEVSTIGRIRCINKPVLPSELRYNLMRSFRGEDDTAVQQTIDGQESDASDESDEIRILVAEDNPVNQAVLLSMLSAQGYSADTVEDGPSVLEVTREKRYDLLLMDCQMPGMDGEEVTRELHRNHNIYIVPEVVVAVTADASEQHRARCFEAGMDDFITKPVRLNNLRRGLDRWTKTIGVDKSAAKLRSTLVEKTATTSEEFLNQYIELFLDDSDARLQVLRSAVLAEDRKLVQRESHALKGACLEFGAARMARFCDAMSNAVTVKKFDEAIKVMQKLEEEFSRLRPVYESARNH